MGQKYRFPRLGICPEPTGAVRYSRGSAGRLPRPGLKGGVGTPVKRLLALVLIGAALAYGFSLGRRTNSVEAEDAWTAVRAQVEQGWDNAVAVGRRALAEGVELASGEADDPAEADAEPSDGRER